MGLHTGIAESPNFQGVFPRMFRGKFSLLVSLGDVMLVPRVWGYVNCCPPDPVVTPPPRSGNLRGATQALQEAGKESVGGVGSRWAYT